MLLHLSPYERVYINVTLNIDEAQSLCDSLEVQERLLKGKAGSDVSAKLRKLLEPAITKAASLQQSRRGGT